MSSILRTRGGVLAAAALLAVSLAAGSLLAPQAAADDATKKKAAYRGPQLFDTPEAAAKAAVAAAEKNDDAAIQKLVGPDEASFVQDGKDPAVQLERKAFAKKAKEKAGLEKNEDGSMTLVIGEDRWPFPVPIVKKGDKWYLDAAAGKEEIRARRIGRNELRAIAICKLYDDAQIEYASKDRDGDEVREYAQKVRSAPGKHDGLFWEPAEGEDASPFGPLVASWREQGLDLSGRPGKIPVGGYYWRALTGQGMAAPGGRHSYVINGNQIAGFALIGYPARYMQTGVMTIMISHHGKIYERDLGPNTAAIVKALKGFNPCRGWIVAKD